MMYNSFFSQFFLKTIWRRYDSNWTCSRSFSICFSDWCSNHASLKRQNARNHKNMSCFTRSSQDILWSAEVKSNIPVSWEQGGGKATNFQGIQINSTLCCRWKKCVLIWILWSSSISYLRDREAESWEGWWQCMVGTWELATIWILKLGKPVSEKECSLYFLSWF